MLSSFLAIFEFSSFSTFIFSNSRSLILISKFLFFFSKIFLFIFNSCSRFVSELSATLLPGISRSSVSTYSRSSTSSLRPSKKSTESFLLCRTTTGIWGPMKGGSVLVLRAKDEGRLDRRLGAKRSLFGPNRPETGSACPDANDGSGEDCWGRN